MNAFQREKLQRSLVLLRYLANLLKEMREHCKSHRRDTMTKCVEELVERMCADEFVGIFRRVHSNKTQEHNLVELRPLSTLLAELTRQLEEELGVMGDDRAA